MYGIKSCKRANLFPDTTPVILFKYNPFVTQMLHLLTCKKSEGMQMQRTKQAKLSLGTNRNINSFWPLVQEVSEFEYRKKSSVRNHP